MAAGGSRRGATGGAGATGGGGGRRGPRRAGTSSRRAAGARRFWDRGLGGASRTSGVRGLRLLAVGTGVLIAVVAILVVVRGPGGRRAGFDPDPGDDPRAAGFGPGARSYALYFVGQDGDLVIERREVAAQRDRTAQMQAVIEELLSGSLWEHRRAFHESTRLRNLFCDEDGTVYVDLTRHALRGQPGNMSAEYASLAALVRTVLLNFPEFARVQLLVDGEPAATLAGHFTIDRPLKASDWVVQ